MSKIESKIELVEFRLEPIKQMVIQNLIQEDIENFLHQCYVNNTTSAFWVNGMIIRTDNYTGGFDEKFKKMMSGTKYFEKVTFVKFPEYTQKVKWSGGNYELVLLNYRNNFRFCSLAKWIKSQPIWNTIHEEVK